MKSKLRINRFTIYSLKKSTQKISLAGQHVLYAAKLNPAANRLADSFYLRSIMKRNTANFTIRDNFAIDNSLKLKNHHHIRFRFKKFHNQN